MTRVTVTGATGLLGTRLVRALRDRGDDVTVLSRTPDTVRLLLTSPRRAPTVFLRSELPVGAATVTFPGLAPLSVPPSSAPLDLRIDAVPPEGVVVDLVATGPLALRLDDQTDGLGGVPGFTPRPPELRQARGNDSDVVVVSRQIAVP